MSPKVRTFEGIFSRSSVGLASGKEPWSYEPKVAGSIPAGRIWQHFCHCSKRQSIALVSFSLRQSWMASSLLVLSERHADFPVEEVSGFSVACMTRTCALSSQHEPGLEDGEEYAFVLTVAGAVTKFSLAKVRIYCFPIPLYAACR